MADVFISYARTERAEAEAIKARLEAMGLTVFLDVDGLDGGDIFSEKLDREVKTAGVVLGLWSPTSLTRPWVQTECDIGKRRGVLVPVAIHPFRDMDVPAPFWNIQFIDLTEALHHADDPAWAKLQRSLSRTLARPALAPPRATTPPRTSSDTPPDWLRSPTLTAPKPSHKSSAPLIIGAALLFAVLGGATLLFVDPFDWKIAEDKSETSSVSTEGSGVTAAPTLTEQTPVADLPPSPAPASAQAATLTPTSPVANDAKAPSSATLRPAASRPVATPAAPPAPQLTASLLWTLTVESGQVSGASYSPDGQSILVFGSSRMAQVWNASTRVRLLSTTGHGSNVFDAAFSPDGTRIAAGGFDNAARVFDAATGKLLFALQRIEPQVDNARVAAIAFSPDGKQLATGNYDGKVRLWDARDGRPLSTFQTHETWVNSIAFSPDGGLMVTTCSCNDNSVRVWDAATGRQVLTLGGHSRPLWTAEFSPDGSRILSAGWDGSARIWDAVSGVEIKRLSGHRDGVTSARYSRDGLRIVTSSYDGRAIVWNARTGERLATFGDEEIMWSAAFSADGSQVVTGANKNYAKIWQLEMQ